MAIVKREWVSRVRAILALAAGLFVAACGGGGGGPSGSPPDGGGGSPTSVTVSGKITFDRVPFDATLGNGLNPNAIIESPARGVLVEAISGGAIVASTTTNATGDYSLSVPGNTMMFIRAKAQMRKTDAAPIWNFRVLNNTNGDALYALDGSSFNSGNGDSVRNLRAASGWTGSSYTQTRAAAPFAILDTIYRATDLVLSASASETFPALDIYWSRDNRPTTPRDFCIDDGHIGTTFYTGGGHDEDECSGTIPSGIYVLGNFEAETGDTDEFDQHIIAHEFGHYFEAQFSRSDSIGGEHIDGLRLDLRVAFGEGWGNAFAGMVLNDPVYRDSYGGMANDFSINLELDDTRFSDGGWFSEVSIGEILWDAFDATNEPGDGLALGFTPIFEAMTEGQRTTPALTSIYSFAASLADVASGQSSAIADLLDDEQIFGSDEFGTGETNDGGSPSVLPIYRAITLNQGPQTVCVSAANAAFNGLGYYKYFRLDLAAPATVTFNVFGAASGPGTEAAVDPDIYVYRNGSVVAAGTTENSPNETIDQRALEAGTYILEVYDYRLTSGATPRCMTVSATGV